MGSTPDASKSTTTLTAVSSRRGLKLPDYLTVNDLMAELQLSRDTVYRLLSRGELSFVRTGKRSIRIHREAFEAWRREQEEESNKKGALPDQG